MRDLTELVSKASQAYRIILAIGDIITIQCGFPARTNYLDVPEKSIQMDGIPVNQELRFSDAC
jgi:hypothetical protein